MGKKEKGPHPQWGELGREGQGGHTPRMEGEGGQLLPGRTLQQDKSRRTETAFLSGTPGKLDLLQHGRRSPVVL